MNRECKGDFFRFVETDYYRCFWDGVVIKGNLKKGDICPNCKRKIDGTKQKGIKTESAVIVTFKNGVRFELPPL